MGDARADDRRFRARLWGEVTLVADAHDFTVEAESEENLGGRWQQRDDPHN